MKYLHLGQDTVVPQEDILGVFDTDNSTQSYITREYLRLAEKKGRVVDISGQLPKSFVVVADKKGVKVYLSQLSSATLLKRSESDRIIPEDQ